ncbi:hypothetical protein FNH22_06530 [Fulvivirga sp. M361]|uniref:hypothetical protein n=1 Tax=Fulvivirga sp. M361 TaxID=2594266 RepID=UPI0011798AAF|nr:hypothetical protein [Fulvivirga sp. M361]TRX60696.1 hypothetical protein FNH22_06530 [Fulvivirga sp. M361]
MMKYPQDLLRKIKPKHVYNLAIAMLVALLLHAIFYKPRVRQYYSEEKGQDGQPPINDNHPPSCCEEGGKPLGDKLKKTGGTAQGDSHPIMPE